MLEFVLFLRNSENLVVNIFRVLLGQQQQYWLTHSSLGIKSTYPQYNGSVGLNPCDAEGFASLFHHQAERFLHSESGISLVDYVKIVNKFALSPCNVFFVDRREEFCTIHTRDLWKLRTWDRIVLRIAFLFFTVNVRYLESIHYFTVAINLVKVRSSFYREKDVK